MTAETTTPSAKPGGQSGLFGRGMLYVVVWSLQLVAGTVVSPILAHLLGPSEFGALASAIALHQVLSVLALLGLDQALVLQRSEDDNGRNARGLAAVGIGLAFTVAIIAASTAPLWRGLLGFDDYETLVFAVILWTGPAAAVQVMLALLVTEDRLRPFAIVSGISAVGGQVGGILLLLFVHNDATTYAWGGVASQFLAVVIGVVVTRPSIRGLVNWSITMRAMRLGIPLAFGGLAYFLLNAGDRIIIQAILGPAEVGRYQVAYVVGSVIILLLTFTSAAWTPRFAALRNERDRRDLAAQSRDELYRILMPVLLGVTLGAPVLLRIVAPASFEPESLTAVVFLVALCAFPVATSGAVTRLLVILRRGKTVGAISVIGAAVNVALNFLLIPMIGILGAAVATLVAYILLALLQLWALPTEPRMARPPWRLVLACLAIAAASAGSVFLPQTDAWNTAKFIAAVACLPWFFLQMRRARRGQESPSSQGEGGPERAPFRRTSRRRSG